MNKENHNGCRGILTGAAFGILFFIIVACFYYIGTSDAAMGTVW